MKNNHTFFLSIIYLLWVLGVIFPIKHLEATENDGKAIISPTGTEATNNTFYGNAAGEGNTGQYGTFIGAEAGAGGNTGGSNTFLGQRSGWKNTSGASNTFIGRNAGTWNTQGSYNIFMGRAAGYENTTGHHNTFLGYRAGRNNTAGMYNTFVGNEAGFNARTIEGDYGQANTFIGDAAGYGNTTGDYNTFVGEAAGRWNETGTGNVFLGCNAGFNEMGSNKLYIDSTTTSTPLIWGDFENDSLIVFGRFRAVTVSSPSDVRLKRNIIPLKTCLEKIDSLQGVTYEWDRIKFPDSGMPAGKQIGLIAQDVEKTLPELVSVDKDGYKGVSYTKLTAVLVEAVKELKAENEKQVIENKALRTENAILKNDIEKIKKILGI